MTKHVADITREFKENSITGETFIVCNFSDATVVSRSIDMLRYISRARGIKRVEEFLLDAEVVFGSDIDKQNIDGNSALIINQSLKGTLDDQEMQTLVVAKNSESLKQVAEPLCDYLDYLTKCSSYTAFPRIAREIRLIRNGEMRANVAIGDSRIAGSRRVETNAGMSRRFYVIDAMIGSIEENLNENV